MKWYGIKRNGEPLGFSSSSNEGGEFCCAVAYSLDAYSDNVWLVNNREQAISAITHDSEWYNANYVSPENPYLGGNLELFEVEI